MDARCKELGALSEGVLRNVGGKAANLVRLIGGGMPVPPGFVVPVYMYEEFFEYNGLTENIRTLLECVDFEDESSVSEFSEKIKTLILEKKISDEACEDIDSLLSEYDRTTLWAVRSSAVAEDLPEASFAGQQDTFLNVAYGDVIDSIKRCWASYWNGRAISYRHHSGVPQLESGIAVVIQKMVNATSSGVMFTNDPVHAGSDNFVIESSWGLGESIVSGIVSPDRFTCKRNGEIIESKISKKTRGIFLSPSQNEIIDIEDEKQSIPSLLKNELQDLVEMGARIEAHFGCPQDIEWSIEDEKIFILQSRPITTLCDDDGILWTRAYGDEYWADATSPLFFSLMGEYLTDYVNHEGARIMGYTEISDSKLLKLHKNHIYFNSAVLESTFMYNPKFSRTKELLNYFPEDDQQRIAEAKTKILKRLMAEIRILFLDPDGLITRTDAAYKKWAQGFLDAMKEYDEKDLSSLSTEELYSEFKYMEANYIKHYQLIRYGMVTHSIGSNLMIKRWLYDWLGDTSGELYSALISGLENNKTIQTNRSLADLSNIFRDNEPLKRMVLSLDEETIIDELESGKYPKEHECLMEFLAEYGHRSHTRELYYKRWAEDPTLVMSIIKALVASENVDFEKMEHDKKAQRIQTEKVIFKRISMLRGGTIKKPLFKIVLHYAQKYLIFRENQRFFLDHQLFRLRRLFLEYGKRFESIGLLDLSNDVFFLTKEEVFELASNHDPAIKEKVRDQKNQFMQYLKVLPPKFLKGGLEFDDTQIVEDDVLKITGTSASPGIISGKIRVITSIKSLASAREGEILVTSNTDPGWTPVFAKLGGLITETGGILSHGAVVSREYGIPAVTAVKNATNLFKTGQMAKLDGNEGIIYILEGYDDNR